MTCVNEVQVCAGFFGFLFKLIVFDLSVRFFFNSLHIYWLKLNISQYTLRSKGHQHYVDVQNIIIYVVWFCRSDTFLIFITTN